MTRNEAIAIFGKPADAARALGISVSAVLQWPDELPRRIEDRVIGAAVRAGRWKSPRSRKAKSQ